MTNTSLQYESLLLVAIGKLYSEQSAYMIKEYRQRTKMDFNHSVQAIDTFVKGIENKLTPNEVEFLNELSDVMLDGIIEMKKEWKTTLSV